MQADPRRYSPAAARNRDSILSILRDEVANDGTVLEVASGSGEHAAYFAADMQTVTWQPSDFDETALPGIDAHARAMGRANVRPSIRLDVTNAPDPVGGPYDAVFCANMIHIAPWAAAVGLVKLASEHLVPGAPLVLYGPFSRNGAHTAPTNAAFDRSLRAENPDWGVRDLDREVQPLAESNGFRLAAIHAMPANNLTVIFR